VIKSTPESCVLVVDDEPANLELYQRCLRGFNLLCANHGEEALAQLAKHPVDILIADLRMPGLDGMAVLVRAHEMDPLIGRVIVSAYNQTDDLLLAINKAHVDRYFVKPIEPELFADEVMALSKECRMRRNTPQASDWHTSHDRLLPVSGADDDETRAMQLVLTGRRTYKPYVGFERLEQEIARASRYQHPLAILVIEEAAPLATEVAAFLRHVDVLVRSGDNLIVVLPETDVSGAQSLQARLAREFAGIIRVRMARYPQDGENVQSLIAAAE
jgi:response regulator RpfG family c-di-GMP phosphodiesterase